MDYTKVFAGAWRLVWKMRALWVFGFILALTTSTGTFWLWGASDLETSPGIALKVSEDSTIKIIGEGLTIDFTTPGGPQAFIWDGAGWQDVSQTGKLLREFIPSDIWTILIFAGVELGLMLLVGTLFRYTSEAAVIRTVQSHEGYATDLSFRQSLRMGWSRWAWRLFGIDLFIFVVVGVSLGLLFLLALSPLLLWSLGENAAGFVGTGLTLALLFAWGAVAALAGMGASMVRQVSWRVSNQDGMGVFASIRRGLVFVRQNFREVTVTWLAWLGVRLLWLVLVAMVAIILAPLLLVSLVAGALLGLVPALLTYGITAPYVQGITPWVLAGLAALPVFVMVTLLPVTFVGGWVRIFLSNLWTLAYLELPPVVEAVSVPAPRTDAPEVDMAPAD